MTVTGLGVRVARVVLELGGYQIAVLVDDFSNGGRSTIIGAGRSGAYSSIRRTTPSTIIRSGVLNALGSLTVRQSVLERVDTVQHDDTWKGDWSEHGSTSGRLGQGQELDQ